jgi:hypothetical protein
MNAAAGDRPVEPASDGLFRSDRHPVRPDAQLHEPVRQRVVDA